MTAEECYQRAGACATNASLAASDPVAVEYLRMAAQWRAMAARTIFLGSSDDGDGAAAIGGLGLRLV